MKRHTRAQIIWQRRRKRRDDKGKVYRWRTHGYRIWANCCGCYACLGKSRDETDAARRRFDWRNV